MSKHQNQNRTGQFDEEVLGQRIDDERHIGVTGFPPEKPLGVEDPTLLRGGPDTDDDVVIRSWRHGHEPGIATGTRLTPVDGDGPVDDEATLVARDAVEVVDPAPEEAAVHVIEPPA